MYLPLVFTSQSPGKWLKLVLFESKSLLQDWPEEERTGGVLIADLDHLFHSCIGN